MLACHPGAFTVSGFELLAAEAGFAPARPDRLPHHHLAVRGMLDRAKIGSLRTASRMCASFRTDIFAALVESAKVADDLHNFRRGKRP